MSKETSDRSRRACSSSGRLGAGTEEIDPAGGDRHESQLLDMLFGFGALGALAGGLVTVFTLVPARSLSHHGAGVASALCVLTFCTSGVALSGLAYVSRRAATGRLDGRVGRALPLAFLFLVPTLAPWTRVAIAFPRFVEAAFAVSFATGLIGMASVWTSLRTTNRVSAVFASVNACEYGLLGLGLALAGGPVAMAGLSAAAAALGVALLLQLRGSLHPGVLGGVTRTVPRAVIAMTMALALSLSGLGLRAAMMPEPTHVRAGQGPHRGAPVLLRGAVVMVGRADATSSRGCRPVDEE